MDVIIYLLFICLVIYIVITLLPVILPIVAIIVIAFSILIWYAKRKEYENEWNQQQEEYTTGNNSNLDSDDVIDVEFTERDDE